MSEEAKISREFYVVEANDVFDYFVKGFKPELGKVVKYQYYYDAAKKIVVFELFVEKLDEK